ncbi:MAG: hypothetical protein NVS2B12_03630 [Ktedonobacteraceae bacterium]
MNLIHNNLNRGGTMTTTGELRAIVEELELVDIGEAMSYLDEESVPAEENPDMSALVLASCLGYIASEGMVY